MDNYNSRRDTKEDTRFKFPSIKYYLKSLLEKQVASSLIFQIIIYFNIWYSIIHIILSILLYIRKYNDWFIKVGVVIPVVGNYSLWVVMEFVRLPLGYIGNASERMSLLSAYILFTLFPSICESIFLCIPIDGVAIPAIQLLNIIQIFFQAAGMLFGYLAVKNMSKVHTESFLHEVELSKLKKLDEEKEEKKE